MNVYQSSLPYLKLSLAALLLLAVFRPQTTDAQVSGISFSISPGADYVVFEDNAGLNHDFSLGGSLGMGFGQYIELYANYMYTDRYRTNFPKLRGGDENLMDKLSMVDSRNMRVHRYGMSTKVNLTSTVIVPYLTAGAGIIRMDRNNLNASESIYISGGAGIMASIASRYTLFAQASHFGYRYNPGSAFLSGSDMLRSGLQPANFTTVEVTNWSFQVGLKTYLGGKRYGDDDNSVLFLDTYNGGWSNLRYAFDTYYGQIFFDESLGFPSTTHMIGVQTGADFGPYVGVRGFYWRGIDEQDGLKIDKLHMFGGLFRGSFFRSGITPFVTLGGGYLHVLDGYDPGLLTNPRSQMFAITGVGLEVNLTSGLVITGDLNALSATRNGIDNLSRPTKVVLSPMFSLGVSYRIGDFVHRRKSDRRPDAPVQPQPADAVIMDQQLREVEERQRMQVMRETALAAEISRAYVAGDSAVARNLETELEKVRREEQRIAESLGMEREVQTRKVDDRTITLPVLEDGEIYIRFGKPAAAMPAATPERDAVSDLEERVEQLLREREASLRGQPQQQQQPGVTLVTPSDDSLERRMSQFEDRIMRLLETRLSETEPRPQAPGPGVTVVETGLEEQPAGELNGLALHLGLANPFQGLLGIRADYGTLLGGRVELMPEFVLGFGSGTRMYNINAIALMPLPQPEFIRPYNPYTGLGLGLMAFSNPPDDVAGIQFTWSFHLGLEHRIGPGDIYVEYVNLNLFSFNRLQGGYRFRF